jgi:endoglucanase
MNKTRCMVILAAALLARGATAATFFADLSTAANTAREDDGIAANGQGGWSDEGINDMFVYPPIPAGNVTRNGHTFHLIDPAKSGGRDVVMLKGRNKGVDKPESADVALPAVKGRFLYFLQNSVGRVQGQAADAKVGVWTVQYADGQSREIPLRTGAELRSWWTGQWWDNSGTASWPFFMGRNVYSMKWNQFIGVWAMQWENPLPDVAITNLHLHSEGLDAPVLWAVTVADENFYEPEEKRKTDFKRPDDVPDGFFNAKLAVERVAVVREAIRVGLLSGVREVRVIRPDLLCVVVDAALGESGSGNGAGVIDAFQKPSTFTITSPDDPAWRTPGQPVKVGRHSYEAWRGDIGPFPANTLFHHAFYLQLERPLEQGRTYTIQVAGLPAEVKQSGAVVMDRGLYTPVIKVNQVAYSSRSTQRYAYLGWWAGDLGAVDYSDLTAYEVIDTSHGKAVAKGQATLRAGADEGSGERVWEIDLSTLPPGRKYVLRVDGVGSSAPFQVGGAAMKTLYQDTGRAFYHQRCGQGLEAPYTTFKRAPCHLESCRSGFLVDNPEHRCEAGEEVRTFRGGYHDAADYDCFTYHLRATAQWLSAFEKYPGRFKDKDLNIPESGNGIPDVLDEAVWALSFYVQEQQPDGGIPLGRGNDQDAMRDWERKYKSRPPFGIFPPTNMSCTEFAAVAAQLVRLIAPFDAKAAARHLAAAEKALAWADSHPGNPTEPGEFLFRAWAAAELFNATGKETFHAEVKKLAADGAFKKFDWKLAHFATICRWSYAASPRPDADPALQKELRASILSSADNVVRHSSTNIYRIGHDGKAALGWGNGNGGGYYGDICVRAYWLTGEQKYLDAASLNADFQLGANPLSKTFMTGVGVRGPVQPQISADLYTGQGKTGTTVVGIVVYGLARNMPPGYPEQVPLYRRWRDISGGAEICSEFTITETTGAAAMLFATLYAEEKTP